jgi:hypothetical protein
VDKPRPVAPFALEGVEEKENLVSVGAESVKVEGGSAMRCEMSRDRGRRKEEVAGKGVLVPWYAEHFHPEVPNIENRVYREDRALKHRAV